MNFKFNIQLFNVHAVSRNPKLPHAASTKNESQVKTHLSNHYNQALQPQTLDEPDQYTEVFAWGSNYAGQLGLGPSISSRNFPFPRFCTFNVPIKLISCGEEHAAFVTPSNLLYTMGKNTKGQLGTINVNDPSSSHSSSSPVLVSLPQNIGNIKQIACGAAHSMILTVSGEVYSWGEGFYGATGLGVIENTYQPTLVKVGGEKVAYIATGYNHSALLDTRGKVYTCGLNDSGQLGHGNYEKSFSFKLLSRLTEKSRMLACGISHTLVLTQVTGRIYTFGLNSTGQLGIGTKGTNSNIPLLIPNIDPMKSISAGSFSASLSMESGELYTWGFNDQYSPKRNNLSAIASVSIGNRFGAALSEDGLLYSWGVNGNGQLGQGDTEERMMPSLIKPLGDKLVSAIECGGSYAIALGQTIRGTRDMFGIDMTEEATIEQQQVALRPVVTDDTINDTHLRSKSKKKKANTRPQSSLVNFSNPLFAHCNQQLIKQIKTKLAIPEKQQFQKSMKLYQPLRGQSPVKQDTSILLDKKPLQQRPKSSTKLYKTEGYQPLKLKQPSASNYSLRSFSNQPDPKQPQPLTAQQEDPQPASTRGKQLMIQLEINRQLNSEVDKKHHIIGSLQHDNRMLTEQLWGEQSRCKVVENQLHDQKLYVTQLQTEATDLKILLERERAHASSALDHTRLELLRLKDRQEDSSHEFRLNDALQRECDRQHAANLELEKANNMLVQQVHELEHIMDGMRQEMAVKNEQVREYREIERAMGDKERECMGVKEQLMVAREQLERERAMGRETQIVRAAFEDECQKRQIKEREIESLIGQIHSLQQLKSTESDHFKRALDEIRLQFDDSLRKNQMKDEEIRELHRVQGELKDKIMRYEAELGQQVQIIDELQDKNRKLNDKLNEIIFNKAGAYKQKTLESLKRGNNDISPSRNEDKPHNTQYFTDYILSTGQRVKSAIEMARNLSRSPNREDRLAHLNIYRELERFELSNQKSPIMIPEQVKNCSPLRVKSPSKEQQQYYPPHLQEKIKNSCDKLASALGIHSQNTSFNMSSSQHTPIQHYHYQNANNTVTFSARGRSEEKQSHTAYTTEMIKSSLHDIRERLNSMHRERQAVEVGIREYDQRISDDQ